MVDRLITPFDFETDLIANRASTIATDIRFDKAYVKDFEDGVSSTVDDDEKLTYEFSITVEFTEDSELADELASYIKDD